MDQKSNAFLENEKTGTLMRKYAVPCVISLLVAALYKRPPPGKLSPPRSPYGIWRTRRPSASKNMILSPIFHSSAARIANWPDLFTTLSFSEYAVVSR